MTPEYDEAEDPGTPDMDVTVYTQDDLFDPSDCGGAA